MIDGERPEPGGWNRIHLLVDDIGIGSKLGHGLAMTSTL